MNVIALVGGIIFLAVMLCISWLLKWLITDIGYWIIVPWIAAGFLLAWTIDQRDRRRLDQ